MKRRDNGPGCQGTPASRCAEIKKENGLPILLFFVRFPWTKGTQGALFSSSFLRPMPARPKRHIPKRAKDAGLYTGARSAWEAFQVALPGCLALALAPGALAWDRSAKGSWLILVVTRGARPLPEKTKGLARSSCRVG